MFYDDFEPIIDLTRIDPKDAIIPCGIGEFLEWICDPAVRESILPW